MTSGLDWTIVKPPRLTNSSQQERDVAGPNLPVGLLSSVSRAALATFMLDEVVHPRFMNQRVVVRAGRPHS